MGSLNVQTGSSWVAANNIHVNTGSWKQAKKVYIHDGTGWILAWENEMTETFPFSAGQTYRGTVKDNTTRGSNGLIQGASPNYPYSTYDNHGLWIPGNGSESGQPIGTALAGRTISSFKVTLSFSWSYTGRYNGDGYPTRASLWGTSYTSIPASLSHSSFVYLGTISWYPTSSDVAAGRKGVGQNQFGNDPHTQGNRYPQTRAGIDLTSQLSTAARTAFSDGSIDSFVLRAYTPSGAQGYTWYSYYLEPGKSYTTSNVPATGDANAFKVEITHTG